MDVWTMGILTAMALCTNLKATASLTPTETPMEACSNGSLTIQCGGFTNLNTIKEIYWKIKFSNSGWRDVSHCSMSHNECTKVPRLPQGIKVQSVSRQNVTIERSENNSTINHVKIMCTVDQYTNTGTNTKLYIYDINFAIQCVKPVEGRNLNLTRVLEKMVSACERVSYVHWSINGSNFASCDSCQGCKNCSKKGRDGSNDEVSLDFRRRLRFTGGLILTNIQGYDDRREIEVRFNIKKDSGVKRTVGPKTIRILIERARQFSSSVITNAPTLVISTSPKSVSQSRASGTPFTIRNPEPEKHKPTSGASAANRLALTLTVIAVTSLL